jgi:hypothetical protein
MSEEIVLGDSKKISKGSECPTTHNLHVYDNN